MPPTRSHIRELVTAYLARHPGEHRALAPLLEGLDAPSDPTSRATLPRHITCRAAVIDHSGRVLHVRHNASGGLLLTPGGHVESDDATLMATAVREVHEETGIPPELLCQSTAFCHEPADIDVHPIDPDPVKGEPATSTTTSGSSSASFPPPPRRPRGPRRSPRPSGCRSTGSPPPPCGRSCSTPT